MESYRLLLMGSKDNLYVLCSVDLDDILSREELDQLKEVKQDKMKKMNSKLMSSNNSSSKQGTRSVN